METNRFKVQIDGMSFYVVGNDDKEYVEALAKELDEMLDDFNRRNGRLNQVQYQILTALNLLDNVKRLEKKMEDVKTYSEDSELATETITELENLRKSLKETREAEEKSKNKALDLEKERKDLLEEVKELKQKLQEKTEEEEKWKVEVQEKTQKVQELEDKNYQNQINLADLYKEISILRGESEV
ncbi:cell division protein ZapA [Peptoniphilus sp. KCTC 25270]|uniref:cell division protein ZapA n=1 Tax=Peptoniphilus sp. KCTC 25270 TaxID=2897414 RepID=UPI001E5ECD41|nr:cell division protein ZapA [Peptoniphilus sp. KCTC 25270]MCD1147989.1 cell division protein ZapA [Peptoniphilus sp. KCTC 25270]